MIASSPLKREPLSQRAQQVRKIDRNLTAKNNPTSRRDHGKYSKYDNNMDHIFDRKSRSRNKSNMYPWE
jgi:hypothetical protein